MKMARYARVDDSTDEEVGEQTLDALYRELHLKLLEDSLSESSDGSLSSISTSSDPNSLEDIAKRLSKFRDKLASSDERMQFLLGLLVIQLTSMHEFDPMISILIRVMLKNCNRVGLEVDLEAVLTELDIAAGEQQELKDYVQETKDLLGEQDANIDAHRVRQDFNGAVEEAERWKGLLKVTQEQILEAKGKVEAQSLEAEQTKLCLSRDLLQERKKNSDLEKELEDLKARLLKAEASPNARQGLAQPSGNVRTTRSSSSRVKLDRL